MSNFKNLISYVLKASSGPRLAH